MIRIIGLHYLYLYYLTPDIHNHLFLSIELLTGTLKVGSSNLLCKAGRSFPVLKNNMEILTQLHNELLASGLADPATVLKRRDSFLHVFCDEFFKGFPDQPLFFKPEVVHPDFLPVKQFYQLELTVAYIF